MQRAILIVLSFGMFAPVASAQPGPADQPAIEATYGELPYAMGGQPTQVHQIDPRQTQKLIERWKNSKESDEREKLQTELRGQLKREFAARLAVHEREIKQLEEKVRQLRERLALRREKQDEIVDHRLQQILREAQGLGWGSDGVHGNAIYQYWPATDPLQASAEDLFRASAETSIINALDEAAAAGDILGEGTGDPALVPSRNHP
jgi:hypothetical protein